MVKEYKIAKGWAIFIYLFAPVLIGLSGWLLALPFLNEDIPNNVNWILTPVALGMIILMIYGVIDTHKGRLIITDDSITSKNTFSVRELRFNEIKGYTENENYIYIEPKNKSIKRIKISKYTGGYNDILFWLSQTFPDLDVQTAKKEKEDILKDQSLGWNREVREEKLLKARKIAKGINLAAGIVPVWLFLYPTPYQYSLLIAIMIPLVALLAVKFSDGIIKIDEKKGSAYPSVTYAFIFPPLALMLRAILDYEIFDYSNLLIISGTIAICFLFVLLINQKEFTFNNKLDYFITSVLALLFFVYGYGTVVHINCYYDNSDSEYFTAKVLNKRVSTGKNTTYYLELSTWGQQKEVDEILVNKSLYKKTAVGEDVNVYLRKGKLDIPWYIITDE